MATHLHVAGKPVLVHTWLWQIQGWEDRMDFIFRQRRQWAEVLVYQGTLLALQARLSSVPTLKVYFNHSVHQNYSTPSTSIYVSLSETNKCWMVHFEGSCRWFSTGGHHSPLTSSFLQTRSVGILCEATLRVCLPPHTHTHTHTSNTTAMHDL